MGEIIGKVAAVFIFCKSNQESENNLKGQSSHEQ